jgi:hypothetical protein
VSVRAHLLNWIFLVYLFIYSSMHTLFGPSLPTVPCFFHLSYPPLLPGRTCSALFSNFVKEKTTKYSAY